ncbi:hypothetical protein JL720_13265 [Aureococcus anophagefferens]|nr:hypothetical protein JL720_13265 [Aureococcus anophagefferens]
MDCGDDSCLDDQSLEEHWYSFFDVLGDDRRVADGVHRAETLTYTGWSGSDGNRAFDASTIMRWDLQWSIDGFGDVGAARRGWTPRADSNTTVGTDGLVISARDVGANGDAEATFALPPPAFYRFDAAETVSFRAAATAAGAGVSLAVDGAVAVEADLGADAATGFDGESIAEKEDVFGGAGALDYERVDGAAKFSYAVVQTETWGGYAVYMYNPNTVDVPRQPINCASATSLSFRYKVEAPSAGRVQLRLILMDCGDDACLEDPTLEEHWYSFFDVLGDDSGEWRTASIAPDTLTYTGWSGSADGNRIFDASTIMRWDLQWSIDGFGDVGSEEAGVVWVDDVACEGPGELAGDAFAAPFGSAARRGWAPRADTNATSDGDHCYTAPALSGADAVFFRTGAVDDRLRTFRMDGNELCDACACGASVDCAGRGLVAVPDGAFDAASVDLSENPELVVLRLDGRFDGTTVNVGGTNAQYLDVGTRSASRRRRRSPSR